MRGARKGRVGLASPRARFGSMTPSHRILGAAALLMTSAVGGMDPRLRLGDVVAVEDHVNLMGGSPLTGPNDERIADSAMWRKSR